MGLEDIYQNNVNKTSINQTGMSGGIPSTRERDPKSIKLEQDVFAQMRSALPQPKKEDKVKQQINIQPVGLEQALRELSNGIESLDDKS